MLRGHEVFFQDCEDSFCMARSSGASSNILNGIENERLYSSSLHKQIFTIFMNRLSIY